jgi:hypothetical protein
MGPEKCGSYAKGERVGRRTERQKAEKLVKTARQLYEFVDNADMLKDGKVMNDLAEALMELSSGKKWRTL